MRTFIQIIVTVIVSICLALTTKTSEPESTLKSNQLLGKTVDQTSAKSMYQNQTSSLTNTPNAEFQSFR